MTLKDEFGLNASDFSVMPLVGLRAWRPFTHVGAAIQLCSENRPYVWHAGENIAECMPVHAHWGPVANVDHHDAPAPFMACQCGFFAYYDGTNNYRGESKISGLIAGYGRCIVGERGFRAEKARIVAFIQPKISQTAELLHRHILPVFPDVPVYDSEALALDAHPLTPVDMGPRVTGDDAEAPAA